MIFKEREPIESAHALDYWLNAASDIAIAEARRGIEEHGPMMSMHEGYAVLAEEVDELWDALKANQTGMPVYEECVQVAAVALRMAIVAQRQALAAISGEKG
jgi:hypothetical protein